MPSNPDVDTMTFLMCADEGRIATKTWRREPDGSLTEIKFKAGKRFFAAQAVVASIADVSRVLLEEEGEPRVLHIRGQPIDKAGNPIADTHILTAHLRRSRARPGQPATYRERPGGRRYAMLDIDGSELPEGLDPRIDPERVVRHAISRLPECFHHASCHYQFSSGTGFKPGVRLHLWFWFDRPVTDVELKAWAETLPTALKIDKSLFEAVHLHYTAAPILIGVADPLPRRSGFLKGTRDEVSMPPIALPALDVARRAARKSLAGDQATPAGRRSGARGWRAKMALLFHPATTELHPVIVQTCDSFFATEGEDADDTMLRNELHAAVQEACRQRGRLPYDSTDIDYQIDDGRRFVAERRAAEWEALKPAFPSEPKPAELARIDLEGAIHGFLDAHLHTRHIRKAVSAEVDAEHDEAFPQYVADKAKIEALERARESLLAIGKAGERNSTWALAKLMKLSVDPETRKARSRLEDPALARERRLFRRRRIREKYKERAFDPAKLGPCVRVIRATPGLGKTERVLRWLATRTVTDRIIVFACRSHENIDEAATKLRRLNPSVPTFVLKGRSAKIGPDKYMCEKHELAEELGNQLQELVGPNICGRNKRGRFNAPDDRCEFWSTCPYIEQFNALERFTEGVVFVTHATLFKMPEELRPDLVIIDEDIITKCVQKIDVPLARLTHGAARQEVANAVRNAIEATEPTLAVLRKHPNTSPDALRQAADDEHKGVPFNAGQRYEDQKFAMTFWRRLGGPGRLMRARLYRALADEQEARPNATESHVVRLRDMKGTLVVEVRRRTDPQIAAKIPTLILDATADERLLHVVWPQIEIVRIDAVRRGNIVQVRDRSGSLEQLGDESKLDMKQLCTFLQRIGKRYGQVAVASTAAIEEVIRQKLPNVVEQMHFGDVRGINAFELCDALVVVGRQHPFWEGVEADAKALMFDVDTALEGTHEPQLRGYSFKGRSRAGARVQVHCSELVQACMEQIREAEIVQAADRARPVNRSVDIFLVTSVPTELPIDRVVTWSDLVVGTEFGRALVAENLGVLPLSAEWLRDNRPELLENEHALRLARGVGANRGAVLNINLSAAHLFDPLLPPLADLDLGEEALMGHGPSPERCYLVRRVRYRVPGRRGQPSVALVRDDLTESEARTALEHLEGAPITWETRWSVFQGIGYVDCRPWPDEVAARGNPAPA